MHDALPTVAPVVQTRADYGDPRSEPVARPVADDHDLTRFRGGFAYGAWLGTWPFGRLSFDDTTLAVTAAFAPNLEVQRSQVALVHVTRHALWGYRVELHDASGQVKRPAFVPMRPAEVASALEARGWPVRSELRRPRLPATALLIAAVLLIGLGISEAILDSQRAAAIEARSKTVEGRVVGSAVVNGKQMGAVEYQVAGRSYRFDVPGLDRPTGTLIKVRYDAEHPAHGWERGDDPPGTGDWLFGPLGIVPGCFLVFFYVRSRGIERHVAG